MNAQQDVKQAGELSGDSGVLPAGSASLERRVGPLPAETLTCWRINYGLDRTPHELHDLWHSSAPFGAVLALKAAVLEIERLRAELARVQAYIDETPDLFEALGPIDCMPNA